MSAPFLIGPLLMMGVWSMHSLTENNNNVDIQQQFNNPAALEETIHEHIPFLHDKEVGLENLPDEVNAGDDYGRKKKKKKKDERRRQKTIHAGLRRKKSKKGRGRNGAGKYARGGKKRPADVVLLVDGTSSMNIWYMERVERVQNITRSLALHFLESDRRNRIAIVQFEISSKILLELGKWRSTSLNRAINEMKCPLDEDDVGITDEYIGAYGVAFATAKNVFNDSPRRNNNNVDKIAILITDAGETDKFNEASILRKEFNAHIMAIVVSYISDESIEKLFTSNNDPGNGAEWAKSVRDIVDDYKNDIIIDRTGICSSNLDCDNGATTCIFPKTLYFGKNLGFCGCLPPLMDYDLKRYGCDCCCYSCSESGVDGYCTR